MADKYASLRELIADLERIYELTPAKRRVSGAQAADCLRQMATVLREIAWLPDATKTAQQHLKTAKYKAAMALKNSSARAEDFTEKPKENAGG